MIFSQRNWTPLIIIIIIITNSVSGLLQVIAIPINEDYNYRFYLSWGSAGGGDASGDKDSGLRRVRGGLEMEKIRGRFMPL